MKAGVVREGGRVTCTLTLGVSLVTGGRGQVHVWFYTCNGLGARVVGMGQGGNVGHFRLEGKRLHVQAGQPPGRGGVIGVGGHGHMVVG